MKTKLFLFLGFLIVSFQIFAQNIPIISVGEKQISVKKLNIDVTVLGDVAITTYDMQFYNPNRRVLEGELSFPLEENQSVVRFALDINGNLREAVVVEKEKARVAFEATVRTKIDPALLEKTKGNNYKARIYPIPSRGYKRVVVAFQQKLLLNNDAYYYKIPFNYNNKLAQFSFTMNVLNQKNKPIFTKGFKSDFQYNASNDSYYVKIKNRKEKVNKPTIIKIPLNTNRQRVITNNEYFYFSKNINFDRKKQKLANNITVFWDTSLSQKDKKIQTELSFLEEYFNRIQKGRVKLVVYNTKIRAEKSYNIVNGNWQTLKEKLENTIYDGASSYSFFKDYEDNSEAHFVFTDGLNTLSNLDVQLNKKTYIVNSAISANHSGLKNLLANNFGSYINLQQTSINKAFDLITNHKIQFLGSNISDDELEIYPKKGTAIENDFSISGKGTLINQDIKLFFGSKKDTIKILTFKLKNNTRNTFISKIWAQKKLEFLSKNSEENEDKIITLSKKYQIISDFTSMLILDRVEDYVRYDIVPPKELKKRYDELVAQKVNDKKERLTRLQNRLQVNYENFFNWYATDYKPVVKKEPLRKPVSVTQRNNNTRSNLQNGFVISGVVLGSGEVLPGTSVFVKGTSRGSNTDFDGKHSINVVQGDTLSFGYLGFISKEVVVENQTKIDVTLMEDDSVLEEIVVVGYGTTRKTEVTGAVTSIRAENVASSLQSRVTGITVQNASGQPRTSNTISIRGVSSNSSSEEPLYVVDGVVVSNISDIKASDIASTYVLDSTQSSAIYGSRATKGVVIITTKKGKTKNKDKIKDFENLVADKIKFKGWNPKTPYLNILKSTKNSKEAYQKYLILRKKYHNSPSFYIDVADFFKERNNNEIAIQILTNVAEIDLDNYELLRALAYKFEEYRLYKFAVFIYREILKLRPEDIQSYRDLALVLENNGKYQESLDILYKIVNGELILKDEERRFQGVEVVALSEMNRLITLYKDKLAITHIDDAYINPFKTDIRVVIDWNHNDTDIDLWVIDPNKEKCYYGHKKTKIGGLISDDMTNGFGPEQFLLKDAMKGSYAVKVKYFANSKQKISGPTFLKVTIFKNYGSKNEVKKIKLVRLKNTNDTLDLGSLVF